MTLLYFKQLSERIFENCTIFYGKLQYYNVLKSAKEMFLFLKMYATEF